MKREKGEPVAAATTTLPLIGDRALLSQLFAEHHRRVLIAAYRITGSMADAEDVAQAVFLRLATTDGMPVNNARSYLYRAAINGALDLLRKRKAAPTEPLEQAAHVISTGKGSSPEMDASNLQLAAWLRTALGEISPRGAEMFALRYLEEFDNREIAALMRTSQAVVAVTLHQVRSKLKNRLRELERETQ